jgi:hypothetical protein
VGSASAPSDLKLLGVVAQGASGMALVQQTGKRPQIMHVGQTLADGTQLKSVQGKTATVLINQALRTLTLDVAGSAPAAVAVNTAVAPPMPAAPMAAVMPPDAAQTAVQLQQVQQLQQLQQAAVSDGQPVQATVESTALGAMKKRLGGRP